MGQHTPIEWADSTINPVMGCDGCELSSKGSTDEVEDGARRGHCYAESLHVIRAGRPGYANDFFKPKQFAGRMAAAARMSDLTGKKREGKPWLDGKPRHVFISDMGDALSVSVSFEFLRDEIITAVTSEKGRRHVWLWLTKRPRRMAEFSRWLAAQGIAWPANLWAGTSVTSKATIGRVAQIREVPAALRFLSLEPLLDDLGVLNLDGIGWSIAGGESGPGARPCDIAWLRSIVEQCKTARVPVFVKQAGACVVWNGGSIPGQHWPAGMKHEDIGGRWRAHLRDRKGGALDELPEDLRVRELPA